MIFKGNYSDLYNKISLCLKRDRLINELLINYLDDNEFEETIFNNAKNEIKHMLNQILPDTDKPEIIVTALVFISIKYYQNGNYWKYVDSNLNKFGTYVSDQKFETLIRNFLRDYYTRKIISTRIIEFPNIEAIVPMNYLKAYFRFCFDIYYYNLKCSLSDDLDSELNLIFDFLRRKLTSNDLELDIDGANKTYVLIKSTKTIITSGYGITNLIDLTKKVLIVIDNYYWNRSNFDLPYYFSVPYNDWVLEFESTGNSNSKTEKDEDIISVKKPSFEYKDGNIYLVTPRLNISEQIDRKTINIKVYENGNVINESNNFYSENIIGGYSLKSLYIRLNEPFNKVRFVISSNDTILYDSNSELYLKCILFNEHFKQVSRISGDENKFYYIATKSLNVKLDNAPCQPYNLDNYALYSFYANKDSILLVDNQRWNYNEKSLDNINGKLVDNISFKDEFIDSGEVYSSLANINIMFKEDPENIIIHFNNEKYKIEDFKYGRLSRIENDNDFYIDFSNLKSGLYDIWFEVIGGRITKFKKYHFILDRSLDVKYEEVGNSKLETSILSDFGNKDVIIDYSSNNVFNIDYPSFTYKILINIPLFKPRSYWHMFDEDYIRLSDIKQKRNVKISGINTARVDIVDQDNNPLQTNIKITQYETYCEFNLDIFNSYINHDFVKIRVADKNLKEYYINVYKNIHYIDTMVHVYEQANKLVVIPNFDGEPKEKVSVSLIADFNKYTHKTLKTYEAESGKKVIFDRIFPFTYYRVKVGKPILDDELPFDILDSGERKKFDLFDECVIYTCPLNQMDVNRRIFFNVESVKLDIDSDKAFECNNGIEIKDKISDNPLIYSIYLDKRTYRGFEKYKNLKKLEVEFESNELEEDIVNAVIRTEGDLVLYDNFEKCVLDEDAEFDFDRPIEQFTLKLWRRKDRNE